MSQSSFAEKININLKRYAKWEEGRCQPDIDSIAAIARAHEITVDDLLFKNLSA